MSDLGTMLTWVAIQITLAGVPYLLVHALASRRGPSAGAWVAAMGLALVVALNVRGLVGPVGWDRPQVGRTAPQAPVRGSAAPAVLDGPPSLPQGQDGRGSTLGLAALQRAWAGFEHGAVAPAERCRPWGGALTIVALSGTTIYLLRLAVGLWAIRACRRRGRAVDDSGMLRSCAELLRAMGCKRRVDLRETADLNAPATAGWLRPVLLLPVGWRAWTEPERRAVIAHELGHVVRGDFAVGLLAQLAMALNFYHPLVRRLAGRLHLQQEQAADALGARFAGGREAYLVALARLALQQDGRTPSWPARAFLPTRGAMIRRIEMLRNQDGSMATDRPLTPWGRAWVACGLLAATVGVATLQGPARAADAPAPAGEAPTPPPTNSPIASPYLRPEMDGVVAVRPAAIARRTGLDWTNLILADVFGGDLTLVAERLHVDPSRPDFIKIGWEDIEWATSGFKLGKYRPKDPDAEELDSVEFGGLTVRTTRAIDWPAFIRQWHLEPVKVQVGDRTYYKIEGGSLKIEGDLKAALGRRPCVYLLDDRTIVFDEEEAIRPLAEGKATPPPSYLRDQEWERASRGLLAVAVNNLDGALAKKFDSKRPDDAMVVSCFNGVDHWIIDVADADSIALRAVAACPSDDASRQLVGTIKPLLMLARAAIENPEPAASDADRHLDRLTGALLKNVGVRDLGRDVRIQAEGFGTLAEFASILGAMSEAEAKAAQGQRTKADANRE